MLHEVGQRRVHQPRPEPWRQCQGDVDRVGRQLPVVDPGVPAPDDLGDRRPVGQALLVSELGAERRHAAGRQQSPQLVLGGHTQHPHARLRGGGIDRLSPEERRIGHLNLTAGAVEVVVARDPVAGGAHAGHDRHVVGVGERRDLGARQLVDAAAVQRLGKSRHQAPLQRFVDVLRVPPVGADRQHWPVRRPVTPTVGLKRNGHVLTRLSHARWGRVTRARSTVCRRPALRRGSTGADGSEGDFRRHAPFPSQTPSNRRAGLTVGGRRAGLTGEGMADRRARARGGPTRGAEPPPGRAAATRRPGPAAR